MLKRFGLAGILMAVLAIAPITASAETRYDAHNQSTRTAQVRYNNNGDRRDNNSRDRHDNNGFDRHDRESRFRNVRDGRGWRYDDRGEWR